MNEHEQPDAVEESNDNAPLMRRIRSFVRREGRLTTGQERALAQYWPTMGVEFTGQMLDLVALFGREAPLVLEIGFGMGASLVEMAKSSPEKNFIGIEVHRPGVGACLSAAAAEGVTNLRVFCHDAVEVLEQMIPVQSVDTLQLFFPDPCTSRVITSAVSCNRRSCRCCVCRCGCCTRLSSACAWLALSPRTIASSTRLC